MTGDSSIWIYKMLQIKQKFKMLPHNFYQKLKFQHFERRIHPLTWKKHDDIMQWANQCVKNIDEIESSSHYETTQDPIVKQGFTLIEKVKRDFAGKYKHLENMRVLVHVPSSKDSPGGFSVFNNFVQALNFIGIPVKSLEWNQPIEMHLQDFKPTVFITSDDESYFAKINWDSVEQYRKLNGLKLGLFSSFMEEGNTPLKEKLDWAQMHRVDFYCSFRTPEFLKDLEHYDLFHKNVDQVYSIEFGANPLLYYPVPNIDRDMNYVFLASSNPDKWKRYFEFFPKLLSAVPGFIDGPGWSRISQWAPPQTHRYLYARAKVGINLHIADSIDWASELNERTYILAACGVPQLVDNAKLLTKRFTNDCFFVADTAKEYEQLFHYILDNPIEAQKRAIKAQKEVFSKHTTFHRAEDFITHLILNS